MKDYRTMTELEKLACQVAISAPERQGTYSGGARISWELIHAIRKEMGDFDWRGAAKRYRQIVEAEKKRGAQAARELIEADRREIAYLNARNSETTS